MSMSRLAAFDQYLRDNLIPIDGLSGSQPYGPDTVTISFRPEATAEQIAWANQAKSLYDWRPRRFLTDTAIASGFAGLTTSQQNAVLRRVVARFLVEHQAIAIKALADLGVSLPFDEVIP